MEADLARRAPIRVAEALPSGVLGMALFIATETMFFAGLICAFLVLRAGHGLAWPPPGQPRLPQGVTAVNTLALLLSGLAMHRALGTSRERGGTGAVGWLSLAAVLGTCFLLVQGSEWVRLVSFGLTMTSSVYGGTFYALIGAHALHVLGALIGLLAVTVRAGRGRYTPQSYQGVRVCRMYWMFVVGIWPLLYGLVYF